MIRMRGLYVLCFVTLFCRQLSAQVYNYEPVRYSQPEVNPAYLASGQTRQAIMYGHTGSAYDPHHFYQDVVRYRFYNPRYFTGFGFTASQTHVGDSASYISIGAGLAYRTVLFNKVFFRLGAYYKQNWFHGYAGRLTYYGMSPKPEAALIRKSTGTMNISLSCSSPSDKYFVAAGVLNYRLPSFEKDTLLQVPSYAYITVGDFLKMLTGVRNNRELSYTLLLKQYSSGKSSQWSHYINLYFRLLQLTRTQQIRAGIRSGITDDRYIKYTPMLAYEQKSRGGFFTAQLGLDMAYDVKHHDSPFKPTLQLNIIRTF